LKEDKMIYTKKECVWLGFLLIGVAFLGFMADDFTDNIYTFIWIMNSFFGVFMLFMGVFISDDES
ncbi:TPA: hypothetical protein ACHJ77_005229, partial [Escherichia coli]